MQVTTTTPISDPDVDVEFARPIPPAHSIAQSVRALNTILGQLSGKAALTNLSEGDSCARVNVDLWAPAWEGARNFRDQFLVTLSRMTRDEWRMDVADIVKNQPEFNRANMISKSLEARLRITLDFAFRFLTPRHVCFLGDVLMLAFEAEMKPADFSNELAASAARSPYKSEPMLEALVLGASGMHRYQPERVMSSASMKSN